MFEPDAGPTDGLIKGFHHASGDILGFINSDDYLLPDALCKVTDFFKKSGFNCFMTGQGYMESDTGALNRIHPEQLSARDLLYRATVIFQQTTFFPAKLYKQVNGFNPENTTCWDYELFLDFLLAGASHQVIHEDLAVFRLYQGSISGSGRLTQQCFKDLSSIFKANKGRNWTKSDEAYSLYLRCRHKLRRLMQAKSSQ